MSNNIRIIDPVYFNAGRSAEFRLNEDSTAYITSGMYLCIGAFGDNAKLNVVGYNRRAGVASVVSSIRLLNGGDVIAQLENAGQWMAWKGCNHDNADARSKKQGSFASGSLIHYGITADVEQQIISSNGDAVAIGTLGTTDAEACLGQVAIKDFLKELEVLRALPTSIFENLRLVVDFTTNIKTICDRFQNDAEPPVAVANLKAMRPLLVCDVVTDVEIIKLMVKDMGQMSFTGIESDRFVLDAVGPTERKTQVQTIRGFNNKVVNRVLVVNSPSSDSAGVMQNKGDGDGTYIENALGSGKLNSLVQNRYTINCRVNGSSIFSGRGLGYDESYGATTGAGYNHRLAILGDTWGDTSLCQGANTCGLVVKNLMDGANANRESIIAKNPGHLFYGQDYTGFKIMDRVSHLEFTVSRSGVAVLNRPVMNAGATNQAIHQYIYAEIPKMLIIQDGRYRISYL